MLFLKKPDDFDPIFEAAGCFCDFQGKFILLHRQDHLDVEPNKWGLPSGKIDYEYVELPREGMQREIKEETGLIIPVKRLYLVSITYVRFPDFDFTYYIFRTRLLKEPKVRLNPKEHKDWQIVSPGETKKFDLFMDLEPCIKLCYGF